jgi:hypothetical protein
MESMRAVHLAICASDALKSGSSMTTSSQALFDGAFWARASPTGMTNKYCLTNQASGEGASEVINAVHGKARR